MIAATDRPSDSSLITAAAVFIVYEKVVRNRIDDGSEVSRDQAEENILREDERADIADRECVHLYLLVPFPVRDSAAFRWSRLVHG